MKRYRFKLESVLKMRQMAEEKSRQELGRLMVEREKIGLHIRQQNEEIHNIYNEQEKMLKESAKPNQLAFFSKSIEAKKKVIEDLNQKLNDQESKINLQRQDLIQKKSELKMIEKLNEKEFEKYKKEYEKELNQKIEEQVQLWKEYQKDWV